MRWLLLVLLTASCGPSEPCLCPEAPEVAPEPERPLTGQEKALEERRRCRKEGVCPSKSRPGEMCHRIELDEAERWDQSFGFESEMVWLEEACYQSSRFRNEYIWCMFGTDKQFRFPSRTRKYYPCLFSSKYEVKHGLVKRGADGKWLRTR